ncbi:MAG: acyltransferase, partial [Saprospiraceae bacterium]|nr:acyltransferase [Saprospiraceae bacterium]
MKARIEFLDHLRTFAIFCVVLLHSGLVYEQVLENMWIISDPVKNDSIGLIRMYLDLFVMFTIFFVSGYFITLSIKNKNNRDFIKSKVKRILVPWLLAVFTLIPAYKVLFLYSRGYPQESWYSYFHIFERSGSDISYFSNDPNQNWLWFLPVLFVFQIIYLALYRSGLLKLRLSFPMAITFILIVSVSYSMIISLSGLTGWYHSGFFEFQRERILPYFLIFLLGAYCQHERIFDRIPNKRQYIWVNVAFTVLLGVYTIVALNLFFNIVDPGRNHFFVSPFVDRAAYYTTGFLSMLGFLYILSYVFKVYFNKKYTITSKLNPRSYSIYIIHLIVLGIVAIPMIYTPIPAFIKFILLTLISFAGSYSVIRGYELFFKENKYLKYAGLAVMMMTFIGITHPKISGQTGTNAYQDQQDHSA